MSFTVFPMTIEDYDEVYALWSRTPGVGLSAADERPAIVYFLEHNPGLSFCSPRRWAGSGSRHLRH